ncbi:MAG: hypothetical protein IMZ53_03740 [Thermoplasmata archaeon]|nr:hypothetical protein [Thermoplasmata archaeon]
METVTDTLESRLLAMPKSQLIQVAKDEFNLEVDGRLSEKSIIRELLNQNTAQQKEAKEKTTESTKMVVTNDDPLVTILFMPLDFPNAPVEFNYDSGRGVMGTGITPEQKIEAKKLGLLEKMPHYHLFPGQTYDLPMSVIKHLKGLTFRDSIPIINQQTGMIDGNKPVIKPRFSLDVQLTDEQYRQVGKPNTL